MRLLALIPGVLFLSLLFFLWRGLHLDPHLLPSALLNKPIPEFSVSGKQSNLTSGDFKGHVSLLNVWGTWCYACRYEHQFLVSLAKKHILPIYGLAYKDDPNEIQQWLQRYGDPYKKIGLDKAGKVAIDFGVYGAPESFIIDKAGVIRYKQVGPITAEIWQKKLMPLIQQLQGKAA